MFIALSPRFFSRSEGALLVDTSRQQDETKNRTSREGWFTPAVSEYVGWGQAGVNHPSRLVQLNVCCFSGCLDLRVSKKERNVMDRATSNVSNSNHVAPLERRHRRRPLTINIPLLGSGTMILFVSLVLGHNLNQQGINYETRLDDLSSVRNCAYRHWRSCRAALGTPGRGQERACHAI